MPDAVAELVDRVRRQQSAERPARQRCDAPPSPATWYPLRYAQFGRMSGCRDAINGVMRQVALWRADYRES